MMLSYFRTLSFKNCPPFIKCTKKVDRTTTDDAQDLDLLMSMYNLLDCSSNYSDTIGNLWLYSKDEATNFHNDVGYTDDLKYFKCVATFLGNIEANEANGILRNITITMLLKYLRNFLRFFEIPLINFKVELKLKWTNYYILASNNADNAIVKSNDITFIIEDTKPYALVVTLSAKHNQKLSKLLNKGFERSVYWNEYKTKSESKNTT